MSYFDIPHTRDSDADLGWVIDQMKKLLETEGGYDDRITALENQIANLPETIRNEVNSQITPIINQIYSDLTTFENSVNNSIANQNKLISNLEYNFDLLENMVNSSINAIRAENDYNNLYLKSWVENELKNFNKDYPLLNCPADGKVENVQTVVNDIYNALSLGIPVWQFDNLMITPNELDNKYTVQCFDRYAGLFMLIRSATFMISPISGKYADSRDVINQLADLHKNGVQVSDFDNKKITVNAFDTMNLTVHTVDWTREWFDNIV